MNNSSQLTNEGCQKSENDKVLCAANMLANTVHDTWLPPCHFPGWPQTT